MNGKRLFNKNYQYIILSLICVFLLATSPVQAKNIAGVHLKESIKLGKTDFILNGAGQRSKLFIDLYIAALYLPRKSQNAQSIIDSDQEMFIQIHVISNLITSENLSRGTAEGFSKSTGNNTAAIQTQIDEFLSAFSEPVEIGDIFEIVYQPDNGVTVVKNRHITKRIPVSLEFKRALFGIWLSDKPAQSSLRNSMLGK